MFAATKATKLKTSHARWTASGGFWIIFCCLITVSAALSDYEVSATGLNAGTTPIMGVGKWGRCRYN